MGLSFVGCVVVASVLVVMTGSAYLGACLSMWLMEKFLGFMAAENVPSDLCICGCERDLSVRMCGTLEYVSQVCQVSGCTEVPGLGETICNSCWDKHDSYNTPGFPEGFDDISEEHAAWLEREENNYADRAAGDQESVDRRDA